MIKYAILVKNYNENGLTSQNITNVTTNFNECRETIKKVFSECATPYIEEYGRKLLYVDDLAKSDNKRIAYVIQVTATKLTTIIQMVEVDDNLTIVREFITTDECQETEKAEESKVRGLISQVVNCIGAVLSGEEFDLSGHNMLTDTIKDVTSYLGIEINTTDVESEKTDNVKTEETETKPKTFVVVSTSNMDGEIDTHCYGAYSTLEEAQQVMQDESSKDYEQWSTEENAKFENGCGGIIDINLDTYQKEAYLQNESYGKYNYVEYKIFEV